MTVVQWMNDDWRRKPRKLGKMSPVCLFCHHASGVLLPGMIPIVRDGTRAVVSWHVDCTVRTYCTFEQSCCSCTKSVDRTVAAEHTDILREVCVNCDGCDAC